MKREELYIVTKLPPLLKHKGEEMIKTQLKSLQVDYIDCYLDHLPFSIYKDEEGQTYKFPIHKMWTLMESFVEKGYTKSIGVSNYHVQLLMDLLSYCKIKPVNN